MSKGCVKMTDHRDYKLMEIKELKNRVLKLEESQKELVKISTILELYQEDSRKRDKILQQHTNTLVQINNSLSNMNHTVSGLDVRLNSLENSFNKLDENTKIDIQEHIKRFLIIGLPYIGGTLLVAYLLYLFGLD